MGRGFSQYRSIRTLSLFFAALFTLAAATARAESAPGLPGWSEVGGTGVRLNGREVIYSSPAIADLDGNPSNGKEVVVGGSDGIVHAYRADGTKLWSAPTPNASCAGAGTTNKILSSPAVGDLFGNGQLYVVIGYGGPGGNICDGGVTAIRGSDGVTLWTFSLKKFARRNRFGAISHSVVSSPALADTDGDGRMEIGFGSFDRNVYLLNATGKVRWYYNAADSVWSSPAFANVDNDPQLEMLIGTDISANSRLKPATKNGGFLYAFDTKARKPKRVIFQSPGSFVWRAYFDQVVWSSPVVADVIPGNANPEVIVGSGCFFPQGSSDKNGRWVKILRITDGAVLQTLRAPGCLTSTVAVGDIDDDGQPEIVATVNGDASIGGDGQSRIVAWKPGNPEPFWSIVPLDRGRNDSFGGNFQSPVLADLDGNGSLEVIAANNTSVGIYNGRDGSALTCQDSSCNGLRLGTAKALKSTPSVTDMNGDGQFDVVIGGGSGSAGAIYGWTGFSGILGSPPGAQPSFHAPWPTYRGNPQHTANTRH